MIREARERYDPRLYKHFEFLYDEMTRQAGPIETALTVTSEMGAVCGVPER